MQSSALLGPAYTLTQTGNVYHAGLSYGSTEAITKYTGKTPGENLKNLLKFEKNDSEFETLVKNRIIETRKKLNLSNQ